MERSKMAQRFSDESLFPTLPTINTKDSRGLPQSLQEKCEDGTLKLCPDLFLLHLLQLSIQYLSTDAV
jgi:hypothetical protein